MPFEEYWKQIEDDIVNHYDNSIYWVNIIPSFEIKIWNLDDLADTNIKGNPSPKTNKGFQSVKSLAKSIHTTSSQGFHTPSLSGFLGFPSFLSYQRLAKNSHPFGWSRKAHINSIKPFKERKFYDKFQIC